MRCAWQEYINILPHWIRADTDRIGREGLQELRLRTGLHPELIMENECRRLSGIVSQDDITYVINSASEYSPWTASSVSKGYLSAPGGHRVGICGICTIQNSEMTGIHQPVSLCIRVARDFDLITNCVERTEQSILILGPPGSGKTTLLRDLIRKKSNQGQGSISVVDEREEIFPLVKGKSCFPTGLHTDILSRCSKRNGINAVLRSMNPEWIAVDEITEEEDSKALLYAGWCGVRLLATAHAGSVEDYLQRPTYAPLVKGKLFSTIILMRKNKSWSIERI